MKTIKLFAFLLTAVLLLNTLSSTALAEYAPVEYRLYPAPEGAYVGDTMPFVTEDGLLEFYFLYDTDHNGQGYHPIYKYVTDDLIDYEDHGIVLPFGYMSDPDPAIGTGSVMQDQNGLYHLFYTGHNDIGNNGRGKECVMHAVSTDRENWNKLPEDTFFSPDGYSKDDFRDPEVFWVEEEQCYWLLIAAREQERGGVVAKFTSTDLKNWEFSGPIYAPMAQYMLECPDLFRIGDKWYLTYSWDCVTYYAMSDFINGPFQAPTDNVLDGNNFIFYAAKTAELDGHYYLCGWLGRSGLSVDSGIYQWAGSILNHELVQLEDGRLGVKAPETFLNYFTEEQPFETEILAGSVEIEDRSITLQPADEFEFALADLGMRAPTLLLECDVTLDENGCAGFAFGGPADQGTYYCLCLDDENDVLHYEGTEIFDLDRWGPEAYTKFDFSANSIHHVTLVCENEIVVLYVDNMKALSSRIRASIDGAYLAVFSYDCGASFSNISIKIPA